MLPGHCRRSWKFASAFKGLEFGRREDCKTVYPGSIPGVASIEDQPAFSRVLHTLGNRFSPLGVSYLSVKSRQQYLLFSGQLYQIRNMYWRPIALQNTCNFNAARPSSRTVQQTWQGSRLLSIKCVSFWQLPAVKDSDMQPTTGDCVFDRGLRTTDERMPQ